MTAAARGAAGAMVVRARRRRRARIPFDAVQQTERHLARFVGAERAHELASEHIASLQRRKP